MIDAAHPKTAARWLPYAALALGLCVFATGAVFVRMAQAEQIPSLAIAVLRYFFAVMILSPQLLTRHGAEIRRLAARDFLLIALTGTTFAIALFCFFTALEHTTILIANLFSNTHPLWVGLIEALVLKALLDRRVWLGLLLALGGGALFSLSGLAGGADMGANPPLGMLFALGSALLSTTYFILIRTLRARISTLALLWLSLMFGLALLLVMALLTGTALTGYSVQGYLWILLVSITGQVAGQYLLTYTLAHLPATFVSVSMLAQVILSAVLAFFAFGEQPGAVQVVASGVILTGVVVVMTARTRA